MGDDPRDQPRNHPYDVDWFRKSHLENVKRRGRLRKAIGRISFAIDSSQGLLIGLLSSLIIFGTIGIVVAAFYLGPAAFVGVLVGLLGRFGLRSQPESGRVSPVRRLWASQKDDC